MKLCSHHRLLPTAIACFLSLSLNSQQILSLDACLDSLKHTSPDAQKLALAQQVLETQAKINKLTYAPQLSFNGKASWQSDVTHFDVSVPGVEVPQPPNDQYAFILDLVQPIYDGGYARNHNAVLEDQAKVSSLEYLVQLHQMEELVTDLYFNIALQDQLVQSQELLITQLERVIHNLEENYKQGTADKPAVLEAHIRMREAVQRRDEAKMASQAAHQSLAVLLELDPDGFDTSVPESIQTVPTSLNIDQRPDYRLLGSRITLLESSDQLNRSQYNPRFSLFATGGYGNPGLNFLNTSFDTYFIVGASLRIPLTQIYTGQISRESEISRIRQEELNHTRTSLSQSLTLKEIQYKSDLEKLRQWIIEDKEIIAMREEIVKASEARLEAGVITTPDFLDELTDLSLAQGQRVTHEVQLMHTQARLNLFYGTNDNQ